MFRYFKCINTYKKIKKLYDKKKYSEFNQYVSENIKFINNKRRLFFVLFMKYNVSNILKLNKKSESEFYYLTSFIDKNFKKNINLQNFLKSVIYKNQASYKNNKRLFNKSNSFHFNRKKIPFIYKIIFKNYLPKK